MSASAYLKLAGIVAAGGAFLALVMLSSAPKPTTQPGPVLNIIVAVDLSDRICPNLNPGQADRDKATICAIIDAFEHFVAEQGMYLLAEHRLILSVLPQPGVDYEALLRELADSLRLDAAKLQIGGKPAFDAARAKFEDSVTRLYEAAVQNEYAGADVWSWVRDSLPLYEIPATPERPVRKGVLIILTDGYPILEKEVQAGRPEGSYLTGRDITALRSARPESAKRPGLTPIPRLDLSAWQVLILEVRLQQVQDRPMLERLWCDDWFTKMGASGCGLILRQDSVEQTREVLAQWIDP